MQKDLYFSLSSKVLKGLMFPTRGRIVFIITSIKFLINRYNNAVTSHVAWKCNCLVAAVGIMISMAPGLPTLLFDLQGSMVNGVEVPAW